jgi:endogenous inhibitor of DNA gyrase (YacG/DUF329 family)
MSDPVFLHPRPCPICSKPATPKMRPFCSKHCADVDLNRWLKGTYAIPAVEPQDEWSQGVEAQDADEPQ